MSAALFYFTSFIAVLSTVVALTRTNATHALIYLILSLLSVAVLFFLLGAPFAAALEVLIYAGAIMVLFVFVAMMLNLGERGEQREQAWLTPRALVVPGLIAGLLLAQLLFVIAGSDSSFTVVEVTPRDVGLSLYGPYVLAVELASLLLLAALVGAYHVARRFVERGGQG